MPSSGRISLIVILVLSAGVLSAQSGGPLMSHYRKGTEIETQSWAMCQDNYNVMMFANVHGILTFDGQAEDLIKIPVIPYSIKYNPQEKKVYVGGDNNYGYLKRDEKGFYQFISMRSDSSRIGIISKIVFTDSTVWFYGDRTILRHQIKTGKLELRLTQKENRPFTGMFVTPKNIFINVLSKGLYRLEADTLFPIVTGYLLENNEVLFGLPYDRHMVLLGLGDGSLSLFDGIKFYPYQVKDNGYLKGNSLSEGIVISDTLYAFATLDGGAMVVERNSGKIRYTINYLDGLPDDEIFALGSDNNNGLWLSHQYGLTRVELMLPIGNLGVYPGLKGNLISPIWHNNELYVSSSEGVFYLAEVKNYSEIEIMVRQEQPAINPSSAGEPGSDQNQQGQEVRKTRRSVFSRIFGKKLVPEIQVTQAEGKAGGGTNASEQPVFVRKTVNRLKSIDYIYKKVEGLNEKCRQLVSTPDGLLASSNKGLYVISDHKARVISAERNINFISSQSKDNKYYVAASDGYFYVTAGKGGWSAHYPDKEFNQSLYSIVPVDDNTVWAGGDEMAVRIKLGAKPIYRIFSIQTNYPQHCKVNFANDTLFIFAESGIRYYNPSSDTLLMYYEVVAGEGQKAEYLISQTGTFWFKKDGNWNRIGNRFNISRDDRAILKIFDNIISIYTDEKNILVVTGENQLFRIERDKVGSIKPPLNIFVRRIYNDRDLYFNLSDIVFESGDNNVYFDIVAPGYQKRNSVQYQYLVEGMMNDWCKWTTESTINLMLPHGTYTMKVRAKDIWGNISEPRQVTFTIKTPFVQTTFCLILMVLAALVVIVIIIRFRERHLQREKHILEERVKERTAEIEAQKQEITSSIEYASRIQVAMLPMKDVVRDTFSDHFIFYKPRDIVSGDFYWIGEDSNHIFFTVADCTGHGVPGAFMSTLGISTLNEIITNKTNLHANTVLNLLRTKIKTSLHQTGEFGEAADGMDIAFCILHKNRKSLEYAGAYNPLFIFQGGEMKEFKADRMPIGIYVGEKESFTNFEITVSSGDIIYIFSDGMSDQFGGPEGSKYKKANLKKLLTFISHKPMDEQRQIIEEEFEKWRGKGEQIDDVTILGLRI
jgi:serine phosphatase RsbU (regulator of sigma subunit)